ncbi:DUF3891 domain-containing protein [filamentous cyanobacterium CCP5]|nr:DUF3891 domain-containing protein [filamentous cyanobacterium CCP5]
MIVNLQANGWEIIYHRAHALLAAQIAGFWNFGEGNHRLYETIAAIAHHDDLEKEWEDDQLTKAGAPLDFSLERENSVDQLVRHAEEALYKGRWVAMLISMHLCFLNQGKQEDPEIAVFLKDQRQRQAQWRDQLGIKKDRAERAYRFMRWCDRLSLILCQRQIPMGGRKLEITVGPDGQDYSIYQESSQLHITPWPFAAKECEVTMDAVYLSQLQFKSNQELTQALKEAPRQVLSWTFTKA